MRLIDADALLEVARNHLALFDSCPGQIGLTDKIRRDEIQNSIADILNAPTVAASPWHRVEEPPEPHKDVLVTGMEAINNSRVYKVMVNDNGTWRPTDYAPSIRWDYWMPIDPPKEEE